MNLSARLAISGSFVLALGVLPPFVGTAASAGETCQGQPATIVPTGAERNVVGTPGPDVVLIELPDARTVVDTLAGDDLVCVKGRKYNIKLSLGDGDDSVVVEGGRGFEAFAVVDADLGRGSDSYVGSGGDDLVTAGGGSSTAPDGPDAISTGDGEDRLDATGVVGSVDMGDGDDIVALVSPTITVPISGGEGADSFAVVGAQRVRVDLRKKLLRVDDAPAVALQGFARQTIVKARTATIIGNGAWNRIEATACHSKVKGGRGNDYIVTGKGFSTLDCDGDVSQRWFGNQGDDRIFLRGRDDEVFGGPGNDLIIASNGADRISGGGGDDNLFGARGADVVFGGNGNDRIVGGPDDDRIYGGAGYDRVSGGPDVDRCVAEVRSTCER